jgi:hypothetical protein
LAIIANQEGNGIARLNVQIPNVQRILFDKLAPALHILAHQ